MTQSPLFFALYDEFFSSHSLLPPPIAGKLQAELFA